MRDFWPSFFGFLIVVAIMVGLFRPDVVDQALFGLGLFFVYLGWLLLTAFLVAIIIITILLWRKQTLAANRPVDGAYPLQRFKLKDGSTLLVNPSMMIGPAAVIHKELGYREQDHQAGWANVVRVREAYERSNMVRAMFPGDGARRDKWGAQSDVPRLNAATVKAIDARVDRAPIAPATIDAQPVRTVQRLSVHDAIERNHDARLALGQNAETGALVHVDFAHSVHVRFHGATQASGKTNACKTLLVGALRAGWHVVICDRRRFKDYKDFTGKAELIATNDPAQFVTVLTRLVAIYQYRDRKLAERGAANINDHAGMQRILCMVSEFGALCSAAQAEGVYGQIAQPLSLIMRESGAAGIHLLFEDQVVESKAWPGVAIANSTAYVGRMASRAGQTVGYYHSDKLPSYHFYNDDQVIRTWDMSTATAGLLADVPPTKRSILTVREEKGGGVPRDEHPTNTSHEHPSEQGKWYEFIKQYMDAHPALYQEPPQGIRALARAMSTADTGNDKAAGRYVGIASETARHIRDEHQQRSAMTGAERLAAMGLSLDDVTVRGQRL